MSEHHRFFDDERPDAAVPEGAEVLHARVEAHRHETAHGFGLRVMPDRYPGLTVGGVVGHGLTSSRLMASLGLRFELTALEHLFQ